MGPWFARCIMGWLAVAVVWIVGAVGAAPATAASPDGLAEQIIAATGVKGGLVVHVGCGDGRLTAALCAGDSYLVHGLDRSAENVSAAREYISSLGMYGDVSVDQSIGERLPYRDNLVSLLVAETAQGLSRSEVLRILAPEGVAYVRQDDRWGKLVKPRPAEIDEWTHYLHDASNNAVGHDSVVGPPKHLQWVGSPRWARHHDHMASLSAMVSAGGRLFYIFDEGSTASLQMPPRWALIARDAFSGVVLWKRPLSSWWPHLWPLKSGPTQLTRRLVAVEDRVYVTPGLDAPLVALDAATGETVRTYDGTRATEEIIASNGVLFLLVNEHPDIPHYSSVTELRRGPNEVEWDGENRVLMAVQAETGDVVWRKEQRVVPVTLAADHRHVFLHDGEKAVCLDRQDGEQLWQSPPIPRWETIRTWAAPTLVVYEDVVLFAGAENMTRHRGGMDTMTALSADTGEVLWSAPHPPSGYDSPEDVLVVGGLVWTAPTTNKRDTGLFTGRDPLTGEVKAEFPADDGEHMPHHRCHRAKATGKYILASRTGIEFVDLQAQHWNRHDWVRGGCLYGIMPANGLVYTPPHSCACYIVAKLYGLNALAPARESERLPEAVDDETRLERGPAYGAPIEAAQAAAVRAEDWPTYRHDPARSGRASTSMPAQLAPTWRADLGGRLTSPVVAGGTVFVASVDTHTVYALSDEDGKERWHYTVGGRIDSPPTVYRGRVLFGSADGWVYCLRAADGMLVWRFRAAPADRRLVAFEQVESVWPVPGSLLVEDDVAHVVAGRSMFVDGGLRYLRLDLTTGEKLSETVLDDRHPETGAKLDSEVKWPNLPVALPDVLSSDGRFVYMRSQRFDREGRRIDVVAPRDFKDQTGEGAHLFCPTGFLDDTWWHRSYWMYGKSPMSAAGGWFLAGYRAPAGRIMVVDETSTYGFGRKPQHFGGTTWIEYQLFSASKAPEIIPVGGSTPTRPNRPPRTRPAYDWSQDVPLLGRALVLADRTLFLAGPPDVLNEEEASLHLDDPDLAAKVAQQEAALQGLKGGLLWAVSADDGSKLAEHELDAPPVWDGMAAANGHLYVATVDGHVLCMGAQR